jgi:hypothetical protein
MNIAIVKRGLCVAALFASFAPIACSSDTGEKGNGGAGGKATMDEGTGGAPAGSVPCGTKNCVAPEGSTAMPCCIAPLDSKCGVIGGFTNTCGAAPPPVPKECPMLPSIGGFLQLTGCCTAGGECGIDETMLGMGCINYADAMALVAMFTMGRGQGGMGGMGGGFNFNVMLPAEQSCTPPAPM